MWIEVCSYMDGMTLTISWMLLPGKRGHAFLVTSHTRLFMEGDGRSKGETDHTKEDNTTVSLSSSPPDEKQNVSRPPGDLSGVQEHRGGSVPGSVSAETDTQDVQRSSDQQQEVAFPSSLPQFEELLSQDSPKPSRKSKPKRQTVKRSMSIPIGSMSKSHTVSKQRRILPKGGPETTQSTSKAVSPTSLANILLDILDKQDVVDGGRQRSTSTSPVPPELQSTGKLYILEQTDVETVEPRPGPSGVSARPTTLPLTVQSSTSSSQGSPSLAATTDEVVKSFVYEEDEEVKQAAAASEQSQSVMPLIKEELRTKIQLRRLWSGSDELQIEPKKEDFKLTLEEVRKRERKKDQNRRSANKSRVKQARREQNIIQKFKEEESKSKNLQREKQELQEKKDNYLASLNTHIALECSLPRKGEDAKVINEYLTKKH